MDNYLTGSFNPCSVGMASERNYAISRKINVKSSFNPCSVGMASESYCSGSIGFKKGTCFNPCSVGMASESETWMRRAYIMREFQSLFCWNGL